MHVNYVAVEQHHTQVIHCLYCKELVVIGVSVIYVIRLAKTGYVGTNYVHPVTLKVISYIKGNISELEQNI